MRIKDLQYPLISTLLFLFMQGCSSPATLAGNNKIRLEIVQETAISYGAKSGLAWRAKQINQQLIFQQKWLDHIFNFRPLMYKKHVLLPVVVESANSISLNSPEAIRFADHTYQIIEPARFVSTSPTWRDYLILHYTQVSPPNPSLLPKTDEERELWLKGIHIGWKQGIYQAHQIFNTRLNSIQRAYIGMNLARILIAEHILSAPQIARARLGITGNSEKIRINDQILRISSHSKLQPNSHYWHPILIDPSQDHE